MSMVTETNSHVSAYQTAAKGPKKITLSESNVPTGGPFAITGAVFITASEPVGVTGSLSVTMLNHSLPVQITNIAALEITSGQLNVVLRAPTGPLGELLVVSPTPTIQMDFFNGLNSNTSIIQCISGGIVTAADGLLIISSGGGSDGIAYLQSMRVQSHCPGQAIESRLALQFGAPSVGTRAHAGPMNAESGCAVGYMDQTFGFFRRSQGRRAVYTLAITGDVPSADYTIELNGTSTSITLSGGSALSAAAQIAAYNWHPNRITGLDGVGWTAMVDKDAQVWFLANACEPKLGTFSCTIPNSVFRLVTLGVPVTTDFIAQDAWNVDVCNGILPSALDLNPLNGNVYNIGYQAMGYDATLLQIMDPQTEAWVPVHREHKTPTSFNPRTRLQFYTEGPNAQIQSTSASSFFDGPVAYLGSNHSASASAIGVNVIANAFYSVFTVRNDIVHNGRANHKMMNLVSVTVASVANQIEPALWLLVRNATIVNVPVFKFVSESRSVASVDKQTGIWDGVSYLSNGSSGNVLYEVSTVTGSASLVTFTLGEFVLNPGDALSLIVQPSDYSNNAYKYSAALNWVET